MAGRAQPMAAQTQADVVINFADPEAAYSALVAHDVLPGKPQCSELVHAIMSTDGRTRMPPGASLPAGERCAIAQWIAAGAR